MFFPTILLKGSNVRHIVKDKNYCECGEKYHVYVTFTRYDLKQITFKPDNEITCPTCKQLVR